MWSVVFALIPRRYLVGAGAAVAALLLVVFAFRQTYQRGANAGYSAGYNHAVVVELKARQVVVDSLESHADSARGAALHSDSVLRVALASRPVPRVHVVTDTVPVAVRDTVPLVNVYVDSDSMSYPTHPRLAALLVYDDSLIYKVLLPAHERLLGALNIEHEARLGADSLGAQWRLRALSNVAPPKAGMSWSGKALHTLAWAGVTLIVARQVRR